MLWVFQALKHKFLDNIKKYLSIEVPGGINQLGGKTEIRHPTGDCKT